MAMGQGRAAEGRKMSKQHDCIGPLTRAGIERDDAMALRRIAMTLHRWHELECGSDSGAIERDEKTGKPFWPLRALGHVARV
jgi:hypothetical protein